MVFQLGHSSLYYRARLQMVYAHTKIKNYFFSRTLSHILVCVPVACPSHQLLFCRVYFHTLEFSSYTLTTAIWPREKSTVLRLTLITKLAKSQTANPVRGLVAAGFVTHQESLSASTLAAVDSHLLWHGCEPCCYLLLETHTLWGLLFSFLMISMRRC